MALLVEDEIRRLSRLLEALLRLKKVPIRELERRLGFGGGTFNRIFSGRIELKVRHILLVLQELEVNPADFFRTAYQVESPTETQQLGQIQGMGAIGPYDPKGGAPILTLRDLKEAMLEILAQLGFELREGKPPLPPPLSDKAPRKRSPKT